MTDKNQEYWRRQSSSRHRFGTDEFYAAKAAEHIDVIAVSDRDAPMVDIGCGAGELLSFLIRGLPIRTGLDYSEAMLDAARQRLAGTAVELIHGDAFEHLPRLRLPVWLSCGAINQYLEPRRLQQFLDMFRSLETSRSLYLFDCVDPLRYALLPFGTSYTTPPTAPTQPQALQLWLRRRIGSARRRIVALSSAARIVGGRGRTYHEIPGPGMGYGFLPRFWLEACEARMLNVEIVSSRYYEYRYHVLIRKQHG